MDEMVIYDCNLNIESFIHMLDDPTECYKFYWLDSIMQLLSEQEENIHHSSSVKNINVLILLIDKFYEDNSCIRWFSPSFYIDLFFDKKSI